MILPDHVVGVGEQLRALSAEKQTGLPCPGRRRFLASKPPITRQPPPACSICRSTEGEIVVISDGGTCIGTIPSAHDLSPDSKNPWKDGYTKVSTRGVDVSDLSLEDRFWQVVRWPLKRHLFVEPFKVIAR